MPTKHDTLEDYRRRILAVMQDIDAHLDQAPDLARLAGIAAFSEYHFHRIFRGMVGESVHAYTRRLRLERAAVRLKTTRDRVTDIAWQVGYQSVESLTHAFRGHFGLSPSQYRNQTTIFPNRPLEVALPELEIQVKLVKRPRRDVAYISHLGPYNQVGATWEALLTRLGAQGQLAGDVECIGLCHSDPAVSRPQNLRYDACLTLDAVYEPEGAIGAKTIPGGVHAHTTHLGPYSDLTHTYTQLFGAWLPRSGYAPRPLPCLEVYLNSPESCEPEDLVTDIYLPLAEKEFEYGEA